MDVIGLTFDGVNDEITVTVPLTSTGDWSMGVLAKLNSYGETNDSRLLRVVDGSVGPHQELRVQGGVGSNRVTAIQNFSTADAVAAPAADSFTLGRWYWWVAVYLTATKIVTLYQLDLFTEALTTSTSAAGTGTRSAGGTELTIGGAGQTNRTTDGTISCAFYLPWQLDVDALGYLKYGELSPLFKAAPITVLVLDNTTLVQDLGTARADSTLVSVTALVDDPIVLGVNVGRQGSAGSTPAAAAPGSFEGVMLGLRTMVA